MNKLSKELQLVALDAERWEYIHDFPDYMISDVGRVWNCNRAVLIKISTNSSGFTKVNVSKKVGARREQSTKCVHLLVAEAFLPKKVGLDYIKFLDGDKRNCRASNLCWTYKTGPAKKDVEYVVKNPAGKVIRFSDVRRFCEDNDLSKGSMYHLLGGRVKVHRGWRLG